MKMSKLSNQTNSQDPQAVSSRVFVGNLNTFQCSKTDVERMFQRYGRLAGISMHKGYAFVQFTTPFDARNACHGEDGRSVLSQVLDVNLVAEPKPHQTGRERQNVTKTGNDWDYYYDSYYASTMFSPTSPPRAAAKRQRLMSSPLGRTTSVYQSQQKFTANTVLHLQQHNTLPHPNPLQLSSSPTPNFNPSNGSITNNCITGFNQNDNKADLNDLGSIQPINNLTIYSSPDILICGNCREMFSDLNEFLNHKKVYCKIRFTCKCQDEQPKGSNYTSPSSKLICVICKDSFSNPWDLMVHAQADHMIDIYGIGNTEVDEENSNCYNKFNKSECFPKNTCHDSENVSEYKNTGHPNNNNNESKLNENLISDNEIEPSTNENVQRLSAEIEFLKNTEDNLLTGPTFELDNSVLANKDVLLPSRSNSPSDNEIDVCPQDCILRTLKIGAGINTTSSAITALNSSMNNNTALSSLSLQV